MTKKIKTVEELINRTIENKKFTKKAIDGIKNRTISRLLFALRCKNEISQTEMAKKLRCSQSKISKIESSVNEDMSVSDLKDYAKVLNLKLGIAFMNPKVKLVDRVKFHFFEMKKYLDELAELGKENDELTRGLQKFYEEAFFNITELVFKSYSKLNIPEEKRTIKKEVIKVSAPQELGIKEEELITK